MVGRDQAWKKEKYIQNTKSLKAWLYHGNVIKASFGPMAEIKRKGGAGS